MITRQLCFSYDHRIRSSSPNPGMNNGTSPKVEELAKSTEAEKTEVIKVSSSLYSPVKSIVAA